MKKFLFLLTASLVGLSVNSQAYLTTNESTEITPAGTYKLGFTPQLLLSNGGGMNFLGFIDRALTPSSSVRANIGFGQTDFLASASYKWIPYPDYLEQPGMGLKIEGIYGNEAGDSIMGLKLHPLISRKFDTEYGLFTAYGSIPVGTYSYKSASEFQIQAVAGSEFSTPRYSKWQFGAELGMSLSKSVSYISGFVVYLLDNDSNTKPVYVTPTPKKRKR